MLNKFTFSLEGGYGGLDDSGISKVNLEAPENWRVLASGKDKPEEVICLGRDYPP